MSAQVWFGVAGVLFLMRYIRVFPILLNICLIRWISWIQLDTAKYDLQTRLWQIKGLSEVIRLNITEILNFLLSN